MALVRVREHVNPLAKKYQTPLSPPDWSTLYADPQRSLHLDIGCGRGQFLLTMAQAYPEWNFLGLEIREPLVQQALQWRDQLGLENLHYLFCNVNPSLQPLLASFPAQVLARVTIQFPDPWFKRRHQKRRVIQAAVVETLAAFMVDSGLILLQSDILALAQEMADRFAACAHFQRREPDWQIENPLLVATEREQMVLSFGDPVYRAVFEKLAAKSTT